MKKGNTKNRRLEPDDAAAKLRDNFRRCILVGKRIVPEPDLLKWAEWFEKNPKRKLAQERFDGIFVSTVFLGLDHGWGNTPLFFETMVFFDEPEDERLYIDGDQKRYSTYDEAMEGHRETVEKWRAIANDRKTANGHGED